MKYDLETINSYVERGLIERNPHPTLPLDIYNYSRECQFSGSWDEITLNMRGTILDREGNVVAKPFPKFFNIEEHKQEEIPNESFEVFEKLDGSLGILFHYADEWHLATKGSFTSDQAVKGREILKKYGYDRLLPGYTYLFEIIYPENRIVCEYDYEELVLLAVIDNSDGYELRIHDNAIHLEGIRFVNLYNNLGFKIVKKYDGINDYKNLKSLIENNSEGFVIKFKSGFRMKIKGEEYVRLHRLLTGFSNVDIWEALKRGEGFNQFLDRVPDEFDSWVKKCVEDLNSRYRFIEFKAYDLYNEFMISNNYETPEKSRYAWWVKRQEDYLQPILFRIFDKKNYSEYIWKLVRPEYQKPFWQKKD